MSPQTLHILLIEDNAVEARQIHSLIQVYAPTMVVSWVTTSQQVFALLRGTEGQARLPRPYLILLDLDLPAMAGYAFLRQLRADPDLGQSSVFVLGESVDKADKVEAYRLGVVAYITKESVRIKGEAFVQLLTWYAFTAELLPRL